MSKHHEQEKIPVRTEQRTAEIGWFDDIIGGDTAALGVLDNARRSNYDHCRDIALISERAGFTTILFPSAYITGQDPLCFANAIAPQLSSLAPLIALRTGEDHPPMLARKIAGLDHLLKGRLAINIINSDLPGTREDPVLRYKRCEEVIAILKQAWTQDRIEFRGDLYQFSLSAGPAKPYQQNGGPLLYFGGISNGSKEVAAKHSDVFLLWPETEDSLRATMKEMSGKAARYQRKIDFGLRIHVIVRETETEARDYAKKLVEKFDEERAAEIRSRGEDSRSAGVLRQDELRKLADKDGYIEDILWTTIGKVFSGCGAGIVGSAQQVLEKINRYIDMGFRSFIFSGFPLIEEAQYFSRLVLPHLPNISLSKLQGRIPDHPPVTPLTTLELH